MPIRRCLSVHLYASTLLVLLLVTTPQLVAVQTGKTRQVQSVSTLSGHVLDVSGEPIAGAQVTAQLRDGVTVLRAQTDASGNFLFQQLEPGRYGVRVIREGMTGAMPVLVEKRVSHQEITIVLKPASSPAVAGGPVPAPDNNSMEFVDKPNFTVAGVTDWTAVGGHGSDATLRTSEALNRETLRLQGQASASAGRAGKLIGDSAAEIKLRNAVSASPQSYEANRDLGLFHLNESRFHQAIPSLEAASRIGGRQSGDEYNLALACNGAGDFAAAQLHVQQALAHGESGELHRLAGEVEEKLGNPLAAVQHAARATQLDPSEANYYAWGTELLAHRAIWQAADVFTKASKTYPTSVRVKAALGAALFAGASYAAAAEKICEASDLDPSAREPYLFAGQIALATASTTDCVGKKLERFLNLRPNDTQANYFYAMFLLKQSAGQTQGRARQLLLRSVELDPKCSDCLLQLGIMSAARKEYPEAITYFLQAVKEGPQNSEAHYRLGTAYDRTGQPLKAKAEYALHEQIDAANAAHVEQERREVKQFSIATDGPPAGAERDK